MTRQPASFVLATTLLLGATLAAQAPSPKPAAAPPPQSGVSSQRLARLDGVLQRYIDENRVPGVVVLVLRDGRPLYERAVGWRDREAGARMTPDTIFRIASQTKALTSAGILMLVEEGKVGINDPVKCSIPAYAKTTVATKTTTGVEIVPATRL